MGATAKSIEMVFEAWKIRQIKPQICRLTSDRKDLIRVRLGIGYEPSDFIAVIEYMFESMESDAKWMRGENPRKKRYLDLSNLLRKEKLAGRVEAALLWQMDKGSSTADLDDYFGPFRLIRGGNQ